MKILKGDALVRLPEMEENSVDAIVTDPPYGLEFMGKSWDAPWKTDRRQTFDGTLTDDRKSPYSRSKVRNGNGASYGADARIMQALQDWYYERSLEMLRVLKPGGYLLAFGGSRTYHRIACAIEDAGFEIRDQIQWIYGSGFPKSLDVSKAMDKQGGTEKVIGSIPDRWTGKSAILNFATDRPQTECKVTEPGSDEARQWQGWGTALKPAHEPIVVARKPLEGTVAANVLKWGTGAVNIDGCRVEGKESTIRTSNAGTNGEGWGMGKSAHINGSDLGRWPANLIHDGSDEVLSAFPNAPGQIADVKYDADERKTQNIYGAMKRGHEPSADRTYEENGSTNFAMKPGARRLDQGSAARFFYCAKASKAERGKDNKHPTVKPVALMRYLCQLVTPPGGLILDPFCGSGTTGVAAIREGFDFIGIDDTEEYAVFSENRLLAEVLS